MTVLLLGASNLARAHRALSRCLRRNLHPRPVRLLSALGPGRGYAARGGFWRLQFPPIQTSPVLAEACRAARRGEQGVAFFTDIGNDLLYNVTGEQLVQVLANMFEPLRRAGAEILVTPIHPVLTTILTPRRYRWLRAWLYSKSRVPFEQLIEGIEAVNRFLEQEEAAGRLRRVRGMEAFLGWDHVHYGFFRASRAWTLAAESILRALNRPCRRPIGVMDLGGAYWDYALRLAGALVFPSKCESGF